MACDYFRKGYFGVCTASELSHVPSIAEMEKYCFKEYYRNCPIFEDFMIRRSQSQTSETEGVSLQVYQEARCSFRGE